MQKLSLLVFLICCAEMSSAQSPCSDDAILNMKGTWKKRPDANMRSDKNITGIYKRIENISDLFKAAYPDPKGIEPNWYRTMPNNPIVSNGPTPYTFNTLYFSWYCNQHLKKMMLSDETATWAWAHVNHFGWFLTDQYDLLPIKVNDNAVYMLPRKEGEWKNYPLYATSAGGEKSHCIILLHGDQLPWKPISQEQYLKAIKAQYEDQRKKTSDGYLAQEENIKNSIASNNKSTYLKEADKEKINAGLQKRLDEIEKTKDQNIRGMNKYIDDKIAVIDNYLGKTDAATLAGPAIIDKNVINEFKGQFATEQKGGHMLVTTNPAYFNMKLPKHAPQIIVLLWTWGKSAAELDFKKQFEENFPVERLKSMLDK